MTQTLPQLSELVSVRSRFNRSVHLERDLAQRDLAQNVDYHLTLSSHDALSQIGVAWKRSSERAMTLIGPYGAGKSAFAVFLIRVLEGDKNARAQLRQRDETLFQQLTQQGEMLTVSLVGSRAPLAPSLLNALSQTLRNKAPRVWKKLQETHDEIGENATPRQVADLFLEAAQLLPQLLPQNGLLLVIDEMGKFLEYAAAHSADGDLFVLQELAEAAARSGEKPLWIIGITHQNADAYAQRLSRAQQGEWLKVSQRFRQIALFPSDAEALEMVGLALHHAPALQIGEHVQNLAQSCLEFAPPSSSTRFVEMARAAYPLHPLALLALPPLFARAGQSHRSVFSFLNGEEAGALGRFLRENHFDAKNPAFFPLENLFDYARDVLLNGWSNTYSRAWIEAVEAVERAQNMTPEVSPSHIKALKIIGLLSWLHDARLKASKRVLELALGADAKDLWTELEARKLIVWSRARDTFRLWEGGDIDIEAEMTAARREVAGDVVMQAFDEAQLQSAAFFSARRHSFQSGTLRGAQIVALRARELEKWGAQNDGELAVVLCLAQTPEEADMARDFALNFHAPNAVFAVAQQSETLREAALDLAAAAHVAAHVANLESDRAARRELELRRSEAETIFAQERARLFGVALGAAALSAAALSASTLGASNLGNAALSNAHNRENANGAAWWFGRGETLQIGSARSFSALLSDMADATFHQTPRLLNELLNRRQLSSAGASARRVLITAMLENGDQNRLGITGFPPEYSMYQSLLRAGGLHRENATSSTRSADESADSANDDSENINQSWSWHAPDASDDRINLLPAWRAMEALIFATPREVPLNELFAHLKRAPFGISEGVLPVLLCAFLRVHERETTLYKDGVFVAEVRAADWEVLLRRPDLFAVAGCRVEGVRREVVERLARSLNEDAAVVPIVRRLLKMTRGLPEHAWKTRRLSPRVLRLRESIERAQSPERLLFEDMPRALELAPFSNERTTAKTPSAPRLEATEPIKAKAHSEKAHEAKPLQSKNAAATDEFFARLNECLREWNNAATQTLQRARDEWLRSCDLPQNDEGWQKLRALRQSDSSHNATHPQLLALLNRLEGSDEAALESVLSLISQRSPRAWSDADADNFSTLSAPFAAMIKELLQHDNAPNFHTSSTRLLEQTRDETLKPEDQKLALSTSKKLRRHLVDGDGLPLAPHIQRAALRELLQQLEK